MAEVNSRRTGDLEVSDKLIVVLIFIVFASAPWWIPKLAGALGDLAERATYLVGAVSTAVAAYAAFSTYRLKQADVKRARDSAIGLLKADFIEFKDHTVKLDNKFRLTDNRDKWNEIIDDVSLLRRRFERKQDQLPFLSTQVGPEAYARVQMFYFEMLLCLSHLARFEWPNSGSVDPKSMRDQVRKTIHTRRDRVEMEFASLNIEGLS